MGFFLETNKKNECCGCAACYQVCPVNCIKMKTDFEGIPYGQIEEGIEKVEWIKPEDVAKVLDNSYENIKLLFETKLISKSF